LKKETVVLATHLPYRATTASGDRFDISFPLHPQTASPMRVSQMLSAILGVLDDEVRLAPGTSNGDILQALAMALSIRSSMIEEPKELTDRLAVDLVSTALAAMSDADRRSAPVGHA
jgi:hypothetical protein